MKFDEDTKEKVKREKTDGFRFHAVRQKFHVSVIIVTKKTTILMSKNVLILR
jgi:hypothetical protein